MAIRRRASTGPLDFPSCQALFPRGTGLFFVFGRHYDGVTLDYAATQAGWPFVMWVPYNAVCDVISGLAGTAQREDLGS